MLVVSLQWRIEGQAHTHSAKIDGSITIGRSADCNITIPHPTVSRRHAILSEHAGQVLVHNLSKTNPIRVENDQVLASGQETLIENGDTFRLGEVSVKVAVTNLSSAVDFKVKCANCGKVAESSMSDCPWCGSSLAFGETFITTQE